MKKLILLGTVLCISLGISACSKVDKEPQKEEINIKQEDEGKYLTEEEMKEISIKVEEAFRENVKYKFAKIVGTKDTKLEVLFVETPKDYKDKGYNEDLNVDTSKLKETKEKDTIELIGAETNILPEELKQGLEGKYIRIGTFESKEGNNEFDIEEGMITSVDRIN